MPHDHKGSVRQLRGFHGAVVDGPAPDVGQVNDALLRHACARSTLIEADPAAADGHAEVLFDIVDLQTLRWLLHKHAVARVPAGPAED